MVAGIIICVIFILIGLIINGSKQCNEDNEFRLSTFIASMIFSILLGILINKLTTPSIEDYIHGKVKIEIQQIYRNGEIVKCDTNYYKL